MYCPYRFSPYQNLQCPYAQYFQNVYCPYYRQVKKYLTVRGIRAAARILKQGGYKETKALAKRLDDLVHGLDELERVATATVSKAITEVLLAVTPKVTHAKITEVIDLVVSIAIKFAF